MRNGASPKPGDAHRIYQEVLESLWEPQPTSLLLGIKPFKAGLALRGRWQWRATSPSRFIWPTTPAGLDELADELRARSRTERNDIFWAVALDDEIDAAVVELYRSRNVIALKERDARTQAETALVTEEKRRRDGHWTSCESG